MSYKKSKRYKNNKKQVPENNDIEFDPLRDQTTLVDHKYLSDDEAIKSIIMLSKARNEDQYYTVADFEKDVYDIEGIRIVIRAAKTNKVYKYPYRRRCSGDRKISEFYKNRLKSVLNSEYDVHIVIPGNYGINEVDNRYVYMRDLRSKYTQP